VRGDRRDVLPLTETAAVREKPALRVNID